VADAERHFREAAAADPRTIPVRQRLIYLLSLTQRPAEARDVLWELYEIQKDPRILIDLVLELSAAENDVRGMGPELAGFLAVTPHDPYLRRAVGLSLHLRGRSAEALPHLEAAGRSLAEDPVGRLALAECLFTAGQNDRVSPDILGREPEGVAEASRWWLYRGRIEEVLGDLEKALGSYEHALNRNPKSVEAHHRAALLASRLGRNTEAKRYRDTAAQLRTQRATFRKGFESLRKAGFQPDPALYVNLGTQCDEAGLDREAKAWYELAIELGPGRVGAESRLAKLVSRGLAELPVALARPVRGTDSTHALAVTGTRQSSSSITFENIAARSGVNFAYDSGAGTNLALADTMGGGVALFDYDGDGRLDIYFINGAKLPIDAANQPTPNRLFRNLPDGTFEDVTMRAGVGGRGYGMGAAVGDYDSDGDLDLFVTGLSSTILYRNRGDGTFEDVTSQAGVACDRWSTAAGFADLDSDSDLDLVVVTYVEADPRTERPCRDHAGGAIHCSPAQYLAQADLLFRNDGNGHFTDVSEKAGFNRVQQGRGLGLAIADFDEDGKLDIFVANDASPDYLFRNLGDLRFEEIAATSGVAYNGAGHATASMGVVADDLDGDGVIDLFITNFLNEPNSFFRGHGGGVFVDEGLGANLATPSRSVTGFGVTGADLDSDGRLDLYITNGHVDDQPWVNSPMAQPPLVHRNLGSGRFSVENPGTNANWSQPVVGRGLATGDLDDDGSVDLVIVRRDGPAQVLRNTTPGGNWLRVRLRGARSADPPVGTKVTLRGPGLTSTRYVTSGTSYLSVHDSRILFGLGKLEEVDLEVTWPSGEVTTLAGQAAKTTVELREPEPSRRATGAAVRPAGAR
jgi:tetratricopeptide (TPR) repeat protein